MIRDTYSRIDQHLHLVCQLIAKVNKLMVPAQADDSHTNLYFDTISKRILGRWFVNSEGQRYIMSLHLKSLQLECLDTHYQPVVSIDYTQKTKVETTDLLSKALINKGIITDVLPASMHYDIPAYSFADEKFNRLLRKDIVIWWRYRELANIACSTLLGHLGVTGEIRIWPHHFDTGIYVEPTDRYGIGFGLAMADDLIDEPYFYLSFYALDGSKIDYTQLPSLKQGDWKISDGFKGAVLPIAELEGIQLRKANRMIARFIRAGLQLMR
ncbi:MAG: hypothetical protein AAGJ93_03845 [Bacteroidota bacterium]